MVFIKVYDSWGTEYVINSQAITMIKVRSKTDLFSGHEGYVVSLYINRKINSSSNIFNYDNIVYKSIEEADSKKEELCKILHDNSPINKLKKEFKEFREEFNEFREEFKEEFIEIVKYIPGISIEYEETKNDFEGIKKKFEKNE